MTSAAPETPARRVAGAGMPLRWIASALALAALLGGLSCDISSDHSGELPPTPVPVAKKAPLSCLAGMNEEHSDEGEGCCWFGQSWVRGQCAGLPSRCPAGRWLNFQTRTCDVAACEPGQLRVADNAVCCWPGQRMTSGGFCDGTPQCPPWTLTSPQDCFFTGWRQIPAGSFTMGCNAGDRDCGREEFPSHVVNISHPLMVLVTPVTVREYRAYSELAKRPLPAQPSWSADNHPVVNVTWDEAADYCKWLDGRLPTEAEWEYAARGGSPDARYANGRDEITHIDANYSGIDSRDLWDYTSPVSSFSGNHFQLYDMMGNVDQWVADGYDADFYARSPNRDPAAPAGETRVLRGGTWHDMPRLLRVSARGRAPARNRSTEIGFRCVQDRVKSS